MRSPTNVKISYRLDVDQRRGSGWCWNEKRERIPFERGFASQGEAGTEIENIFIKNKLKEGLHKSCRIGLPNKRSAATIVE
jgi:hypothetical protein